ncbi:MAG TPA: aminoacyl-tRNA hydrolase [Polyangiaceae bacterium]
MHLVVGLGNPGRQYEGTRHNVGFAVVSELRRAWGLPDWRSKFSGLWTQGEWQGHAAGLLEPQTYMNNSGECVQPAAAFFRVAPGELVVVHDELDLPWGTVRLKLGGGHAGNNGVRSIIERMGTPEFVRVRVGIGKPTDREARDHVLSGFDPLERAELPAVMKTATDAVQRVLADGLQAAMNVVNTKT